MSRLGGLNGCLDRAARYAGACYAQPLTKLLSLLKSALVGGAVLGLIQPAMAVQIVSDPGINPATGQGVYAALRDLDKSDSRPAAVQRDDDSFTALAGFANTVTAGSKSSSSEAAAKPRQVEDAVYSELTEFAQRLGAARPVQRQGRQQFAADSAYEALQEFLKGDPAPAAPQPKAAPAPATIPAKTKGGAPIEAAFVGQKVCVTCHAGHAESFSKTLMGRIGKSQPVRQGPASGRSGSFECENCHGAGSLHVKAGGGRGVGGIISFRSNDQSRSVKDNNAICLACHERGDRTFWSGSTHEVRNVACTDCHTIMRPVSQKFQLKTVYEPETCFQCHKDRRAQMARSSHMPLREGKMVCSDCHQPHGTGNEALLRTATINETCYKCHAEKRGPFLFEHTPVRENCLNCHDAHGSINEFLLKVSRPRLCTECHGFGHAPSAGPNSYQIMGRACNNCHTQVHGTNSPSGALLHR